MNEENKEALEQAAYEHELLSAGLGSAADDFISGANWKSKQSALVTADTTYTQEQMIVFGEDLTKRFNELALHERSWAKNERESIPKGSDGTQVAWLHAYSLGIAKAQKLFEQTLIDISKLLNK
jgi:hypothetical protein